MTWTRARLSTRPWRRCRCADPRSAQIELHELLGASRPRRQRLAVVAADKADPLVQPHRGIVAVQDPQVRGTHPGFAQPVQNNREHIMSHAFIAPSWRYPNVLQIACA